MQQQASLVFAVGVEIGHGKRDVEVVVVADILFRLGNLGYHVVVAFELQQEFDVNKPRRLEVVELLRKELEHLLEAVGVVELVFVKNGEVVVRYYAIRIYGNAFDKQFFG